MYSVQIAVSDGTLTRISLSIEYFEKDDITLYRNLDTTPMVLGTDWQWDGDTAINLLTGAPVPDGEYITVRRNTNIDRAFNIYDGGAAFSRETLDENFRQMIYLAQEFTEGNGLTGLFFPLDMHGFKITNLGDGTAPGDAVNKGQLDVVDNRVANLENSFITETVSYPWWTVTTTSTDTFSPPFSFSKAAVYLDGICQTPEYSYVVVSNQILLADPVPAGTMVLARLGEDVQDGDGFVPATQYATDMTALDGRLDALETTAGGLGNSATRNVGTTAGTVAAGDDSRITGAAQKSANLSDLTSASAARTNLGLGGAAVLNVGTTAGTVLAGNAPGRLIGIQRFTVTGTYTPAAGMQSCIVEVVGGGGAGGGAAATSAGQVAAGCGGSAGTYAKVQLTAAQVGANQAVTVGAGGTGAAGIAGAGGSTSTFGTLISCPGGGGGGGTGAITPASGGTFALPAATVFATVTAGNTLELGSSAQGDSGVATTTTTYGGAGGYSSLGSGGGYITIGNGRAAPTNGGGGGGGASNFGGVQVARSGGNGAAGLVVVYEYS